MPNVNDCLAMTDHFEGMDKLVKEAPHTEGAPNFRRMPGFPVFGTGQPTLAGFDKCLEPIEKKYGDEKNIYWVNLRQEPVVYVNGKPYSARDPEKLHYHLTLKDPKEVADWEEGFVKAIKARGEEFNYIQDQFGEHPDDRGTECNKNTEKLAEVQSLTEVFGGLKAKLNKVEALRIPVNQDQAPDEECFDQIVALLKNTSASTPIVFNCQAGISRSTTGMIIASLIKEFQLASELNHMKGIVPDDILDALKKKKLGLPGIDVEAPEQKNAMMAGQFEVILELLDAYGEQAKIAKAQVDKLVDLCAPPPKGTGVSNLRECIIQDKMNFDVSADEKQTFLKEKIMNNIERYFYLVVFAMYIREVGPKDYNQTFKAYMDDHATLRDMIAEGRSKLEWERKIPDDKLADLKVQLDCAEFKTNLGGVIKRIYALAWEQFSDLPRGMHKNNSMHKLASKTMIEILPEKLASYVEAKCGSLATTPDFFDVIGQMSWYEEAA